MYCESNLGIPFIDRKINIILSNDNNILNNNDYMLINNTLYLNSNIFVNNLYYISFNYLTINEDKNIPQLTRLTLNPRSINSYDDQIYCIPIFSDKDIKIFENKINIKHRFKYNLTITIDNYYKDNILYCKIYK
jgi:hypothetical protein